MQELVGELAKYQATKKIRAKKKWNIKHPDSILSKKKDPNNNKQN